MVTRKLISHFVSHGRIIVMHLLVALHELNQKLHLDDDEFGAEC